MHDVGREKLDQLCVVLHHEPTRGSVLRRPGLHLLDEDLETIRRVVTFRVRRDGICLQAADPRPVISGSIIVELARLWLDREGQLTRLDVHLPQASEPLLRTRRHRGSGLLHIDDLDLLRLLELMELLPTKMG